MLHIEDGIGDLDTYITDYIYDKSTIDNKLTPIETNASTAKEDATEAKTKANTAIA